MEPRAVLQLRGISKEYAGVPALRGVDLTIHRGEVLGLLGQNGAGKSTLVKIMSGAERPSAGEVFINGVQVDLHRPADAQSRGVATIWQELSVIPQLSVAENIYVSDLPRRHGFVHWAEVRRAARDTVRSLGFDIDVDRKVGDLPLAERQVVEIAKAVHHRAQVLLLDEPTATLPKSEVATLFGLLRRLVADGVSVVYISHRLDEVYEICDRIAVLRDGRHVATQPTRDLGPGGAVAMMIGDRLVGGLVGQAGLGGRARMNTGSPDVEAVPALEVSGLSDATVLRDVSLVVRPGEAVAVTGLVGGGQSELAACIFGERARTGEIRVRGRLVPQHSPRAAIDAGLGWLPEERKRQGLVLRMPVHQNLTMADLGRVSSWGVLRKRAERRIAASMVDDLGVTMTSPGQAVGTLSGGNQQKVVFGKWMLARSRVLVVSEPTRGVDVAAKEDIYRDLRAFLADGGSVLMLSCEIDEALMCDRIYVLVRGQVAAEFGHDDVDSQELLEVLR